MSKLLEAICNLGTRDLKYAEEILDECEINYVSFSDYVRDFMLHSETGINDIDIVSLVYWYILDGSLAEIDELLGVSCKKYDVDVYSNYISTSYDNVGNLSEFLSDKIYENCLEIIKYDGTPALKWFLKKIGVSFSE